MNNTILLNILIIIIKHLNSKFMAKIFISKVVIIVFCILQVYETHAQTTNTFHIGLGGAWTNFQDLKYSANQYDGLAGVAELQFTKHSPSTIWSTGISALYGQEYALNFEHSIAHVIRPVIFLTYARSITDRLYLGGRLDILDAYARLNTGLSNNSIYYNINSTLSASAIYNMSINNRQLRIGFDLSVLSYGRESTGFSFYAPQDALENGEVDYQNDDLTNPFGLQYYKLRPFSDFLNVGCSFHYSLSNRITVGYSWFMRHFEEVENYPVTMGSHSILLRLHLFQRKFNSSTSN